MRGEALMPTSPRKARVLIAQGKAKIDSYRPFTIQLCIATGESRQNLTLGVDAGYATIGFSVIDSTKELFSCEIELLKGQVERNNKRRIYRRQRRSRLRYRKARFEKQNKPEGWLAPSIQHKLDTHIKFVHRLQSIMPITETIIEVAAFDIQKIEANGEIEGKEYQEGEQVGFWNLREYILHRDNHKCQHPDCKNKAKSPILEVHHIGFWKKDRTNRPGNLITLCTKCHTSPRHKKNGSLYGWEPKVKTFKPAAFMSMVRWKLINALQCDHTYGYITKHNRIRLDLPKTHFNDAFCIANGQHQTRAIPVFFKHKRKNNRCLEKFYDAKVFDVRTNKIVSGNDLDNGRRTRNKKLNGENLRKYRGLKKSKGRRQVRRQRYSIRPHDIVEFDGSIYKAVGVQNKGAYLKLTNGVKTVVKNIKHIKTIFHQKTLTDVSC